jgi:predicted transcriptional regulator of viral defense system
MRNTGIDTIAQGKMIFTIEDAYRLFGIRKNSVKMALSRLERSGWIERIERGKYMVIPIGEQKGGYTVNEFVLANTLAPGCTIAYWSALNHHELTEQIPTTVFVQTTKKKKGGTLDVLGISYKFILIKEMKSFGNDEVWIGEDKVRMTDPEKTIIDCLDMPQYCGGVIEVAKGIRSKKLDPEKLRDYAFRFGSTAVIRRLGYLCETFGLPIDLPTVEQRNYVYLDPTLEKHGPTSPKWRLKINLDLGGLE